MSVTKHLLDLFRVDKQLRGLRHRLEAAERFLSQQVAQLTELERLRADLMGQVRQLRAAAANDEGEAQRLESKMAQIREQMNQTKTAKEYQALVTELNTFKTQKSASEERAIENMGRIEAAEARLKEIEAQHGERAKIVAKARAERDEREAEIKDRVAELTAQRLELTKAIPAANLAEFEQLVRTRGDEAMAHIELIDRRAHEGSCSACMMAVPVEALSALMTGKLTRCPSCRCILYIEESLMVASEELPRKRKTKAKKEEAAKAP
jgi:predicted  nucleic acid-binding Zn-ribbon protein